MGGYVVSGLRQILGHAIYFSFTHFFLFAQTALANDQKVQRLIQESIASYPGKCACPYSIMSNGRKCGGRSAYSKPGGYSPLCYPNDVYEMYPDLRHSSEDVQSGSHLSGVSWLCQPDSANQMMAYQFFEDKVEIISETKMRETIQEELGTPNNLSDEYEYKGTVFSILDGARVEISHLDSQDLNPVAYQKHLESLKKLDWAIGKDGVIGTGIVDFNITQDITMTAALSYSINLDGDAHQTLNIISGSPLTLFTKYKCERL